MKKRLIALVLTVVLIASLAWAGLGYFTFVSQTVYEESTAHLTEIFHQANQALYNLVSAKPIDIDEVVNAIARNVKQ